MKNWKNWDVMDVGLIMILSMFPLLAIAGIVASWRCS